MNEDPFEIKTYRLLLKGVTLKEFLNLDLAAEYRCYTTRIRNKLRDLHGPHLNERGRCDGWIPCEVISRKKGSVNSRWKILIPPGANPEDPAGLWGPGKLTPQHIVAPPANSPAPEGKSEKVLDTKSAGHNNKQSVLFW